MRDGDSSKSLLTPRPSAVSPQRGSRGTFGVGPGPKPPRHHRSCRAGGRAPTQTQTIENRPQEHRPPGQTPIAGAVNGDRRQRRLERMNKKMVSVLGGQRRTNLNKLHSDVPPGHI